MPVNEPCDTIPTPLYPTKTRTIELWNKGMEVSIYIKERDEINKKNESILRLLNDLLNWLPQDDIENRSKVESRIEEFNKMKQMDSEVPQPYIRIDDIL